MTDIQRSLPLKGGKMKKVCVPHRYIYIIIQFLCFCNSQNIRIIYFFVKFFVEFA